MPMVEMPEFSSWSFYVIITRTLSSFVSREFLPHVLVIHRVIDRWNVFVFVSAVWWSYQRSWVERRGQPKCKCISSLWSGILCCWSEVILIVMTLVASTDLSLGLKGLCRRLSVGWCNRVFGEEVLFPVGQKVTLRFGRHTLVSKY